jgi:hypothetical protein
VTPARDLEGGDVSSLDSLYWGLERVGIPVSYIEAIGRSVRIEVRQEPDSFRVPLRPLARGLSAFLREGTRRLDGLAVGPQLRRIVRRGAR